jgi:peptidoglycan/LPS O-acetylase OafA/YrhL
MLTRNDHASLHGLRGLAVSIVLLSHLGNMNILVFFGFSFSGIGKYGVYLFFVLSAYLLSQPFFSAKTVLDGPFLRTYAIRRFLRVYPLYALTLLGSWLLPQLGLGKMTIALATPEIIPHLLLQQGKSVYWTLPVEFTFYLLLPAIALLCQGADRLKTGLGLLILCAGFMAAPLLWPAADYPSNAIALWPYLQLFLTGMIIAWMQTRMSRRFARYAGARLSYLLGLAALALLLLATPSVASLLTESVLDKGFLHQEYGGFALLWACVLIALLGGHKSLLAFFSSGPLVWLGKISFSLYLLHLPVFLFCRQTFGHLPNYALSILALTLAVLLASTSYRLVERPAYRLAHRTP